MTTERFRILVVDDDPADRFLCRMSLQPNPNGVFDTAEADTGTAGIAACKAHVPDCIVLDFKLPDMDGLEFLSLLKGEFSDLPSAVVMLTGVRDERVAVRALQSGATDYIPKTENLGEVLEHAITGAIEKFRMRRQIEEQRAALEASERQYRTLIEALPQLVWVADGEGAIQYANGRWSEYTGVAVPAGRFGLNDAIFPEDQDRYWSAWREMMATNSVFQIEARLRRASDATDRCHLIRVLPMQAHIAEGARWLGTATDIEDHKQAERAVQQKQKWESVGLLAAGIAHDFNNLLVGILGGASYVIDALPASHPVQPILNNIVQSGERAAQLTRQLLAYSGKGRFFVGPVNLPAAVRETCDLIRSSIPPNVRLKLQTAEALPVVETDAGQLQQVVMNLVINAAEAVPENQPGAVVVRTFAREFTAASLPADCVSPYGLTPGSYVVLEVEDTGAGMDEETKAKIFDPFFSTKFTGRGLGLAAVQGILRRTKGCIAVESAPGKGSTFRVFIPASHAAAVAPKQAEPSEETPPQPNSPQTILIIDDEKAVRGVVRMMLERAGYKVLTAEDGPTGLGILERCPADISLVLLDMGMPEMSGKEVLTRIRAAGISVPVAVCSGYSEPEALRQFAGCEFTAFIQKPFNARELSVRVGEVLKAVSKAPPSPSSP